MADLGDDDERAGPELQRQLERMQILAESSQLFSGAITDFTALLDAVAKRMADVTSGSCGICLMSESGAGLQPTAFHNADPEIDRWFGELFMQARIDLDDDTFTARAARTGEIVFLPDVNLEAIRSRSNPAYIPLMEKAGVSGMFIVPLKSRDVVLGTIGIMRHGKGAPGIGEQDLKLVQFLADRAALSIDNARLYRDLERRVASRTAALEAMNRDLESFTYSVSHDLRAPLRSIDGFARILLEEYGPKLDDEARRIIQVVCNNADRMARLIDDLLLLNRMARREKRIKSLDMGALARAAAAEAIAGEPGRAIYLRIDDMPVMRGDPDLIKQVWLNLFRNAVKFTRGRTPAVVQVRGELDSAEARYTVEDNGVGFDMRYAGKLFGVFQRMHASSAFEGTGEALALVQRIVQRHGGRVWGDARPGEGATFGFAFPVGTSPESV